MKPTGVGFHAVDKVHSEETGYQRRQAMRMMVTEVSVRMMVFMLLLIILW